MFKLEKVKVKNTRWTKKYFFLGGVWCFVLNTSRFYSEKLKFETEIKTVLKPTDESLDYFHLLNIENEETVTPICGPISRLELSDQFDFAKPKIWQRLKK